MSAPHVPERSVEHTPGPWFVEHTAACGLRIVHGKPDEDGFRDDVPMAHGQLAATPEALANVTLSAAAPAMLEALKAYFADPPGSLDSAERLMLAAIAQATGGRP